MINLLTMVKSKPKASTLFSVGVFLVIAYGVFFFSLHNYLFKNAVDTLNFILVVTSGPIAAVVTLKTLLGLKFIEISKEKFEVNHPVKFKKIKFTGKELEWWKIESIKTFGGGYEELIWKTKSGVECRMSRQEHTEYDKAKNYMLKKFKKLQKS